MVTNHMLKGKVIFIRQITQEDCTDKYVDWLNDPMVNQYLETRWTVQTIESVKAFVQSQCDSRDSILFAIVLRENASHIGNIKIGPINNYHFHADISYFIGEKDLWRKGIASEAIRLVCEYGFNDLGLHRLEAGAYASAIGSWKALEKVGFVREGNFREQAMSKGQFVNVYRYGLLRSDYYKHDDMGR